MLSIDLSKSISEKESLVILLNKNSDLKQFIKKTEQIEYVKKKLSEDLPIIHLTQLYRELFFINEVKEKNTER